MYPYSCTYIQSDLPMNEYFTKKGYKMAADTDAKKK